MRIQTATSDDADLISRLNEAIQQFHCQLAPEHFKSPSHDSVTAELRSMLSEEGMSGLIAWEGDTPIGYCLLKIVEREPNAWTCGFRRLLVDQLSVEPEWRRRGVGTLLVEAACQFAREHNINEIVLEYWTNNDMARKFYASLGFAPMIEKVLLKIDEAVPAH